MHVQLAEEEINIDDVANAATAGEAVALYCAMVLKQPFEFLVSFGTHLDEKLGKEPHGFEIISLQLSIVRFLPKHLPWKKLHTLPWPLEWFQVAPDRVRVVLDLTNWKDIWKK